MLYFDPEEITGDGIGYIASKEGLLQYSKLDGLYMVIEEIDNLTPRQVGFIFDLVPTAKHKDLITALKGKCENEVKAGAWTYHKMIPKALWDKVIDHSRYMAIECHSEFMFILIYNTDTRELDIVVPEQELSVTYNEKGKPESGIKSGNLAVKYQNIPIPDNCMRVGSIHTHATSSAFHSGTDTHNEGENPGFHIVLGKLDESEPDIDINLKIFEKTYEIKPEMLIPGWKERPKGQKIDDWMEPVKFVEKTYSHSPSYGRPSTGHGYNGGYYHGGGYENWHEGDYYERWAQKVALDSRGDDINSRGNIVPFDGNDPWDIEAANRDDMDEYSVEYEEDQNEKYRLEIAEIFEELISSGNDHSVKMIREEFGEFFPNGEVLEDFALAHDYIMSCKDDKFEELKTAFDKWHFRDKHEVLLEDEHFVEMVEEE
jgi:hypothetical protein